MQQDGRPGRPLARPVGTGADVVLHALNPTLTDWSRQALPLAYSAITAAETAGATLLPLPNDKARYGDTLREWHGGFKHTGGNSNRSLHYTGRGVDVQNVDVAQVKDARNFVVHQGNAKVAVVAPDGSPVTPADVIYSLKKIVDPALKKMTLTSVPAADVRATKSASEASWFVSNAGAA